MSASLAAVAGALGWTLAEYCIHRWLGHVHTKNFFGKEHVAHHSRGNYFAPTWKKGLTALLVTALMIGPALWLGGAVSGSAFVAGFVGMYLTYELIHRLEHVHEGIGPYGRWARRHHFFHHFHDPSRNHGVTTSLWDHVFRTYSRAGVVRVPEKLAMRWLLDPATGEVHHHLRDRYELRRRR